MLYNFQRKKMCRRLLLGGSLLVAGLGIYSCSDTYDLGEKQPSGLNNIYGYMKEQGNYSNYLQLIEDLGQAEILSKTGSKTMFIADDDAFAKFYASNSWGVKSYGELSLAQKKLLLNSSMIDNPYSTSMLSSAESQGSSGRPVKGEVCRRSSSQSLFDSVTVVTAATADAILPDNASFNDVRANHDSIVLFTDASNAAPMVHFTGKFVGVNKLENADIDFLYNQRGTGNFKTDDVYVNNSKVINSNIFCKNGFIHQVDNVIMPLDNMAELIRKNPQATIYSSLIERFAAPKDSIPLTRTYNLAFGTDYDTVFVKRYFSDRSAGSTMSTSIPFLFDKNGKPFDDGNTSLKYDPGWNGYIPEISNDRQPMMEDMGVMLVPTDAAITEWWNNGGGTVIKDYYGTLEDTPNSVLDDLIRVNQLESFASSVPSRFDAVLNDANEPLGITMDDVDSVYIGCNGFVYLTNKVFAPTSYSSVLFPAVIDTTNFRIISNAIENLNYDKYLNSMVSEYIFLLPTNKGMLTYVDPVSYGQTVTNLWEFHLDLTKSASKQLYADVFECTVNEDGSVTKVSETRKTQVTGGTDNGTLKNRMEDLLDNIIVVEPYQPGKKYYKTKGRTFVKIEEVGGEYLVSGSWQAEQSQPMVATQVYNMDNGMTLAVDGVVMGTRKSVAKTLRDTVDENGESIFSEFYTILSACAVSTSNGKDGWQAGDQEIGNLFSLKPKGSVGAEDAESEKGKATYLLNNFHYTVYAPTNEAMLMAYDAGLPTLDDLVEAEALDEELDIDPTSPESNAGKVLEVMLDFVKYHIQDNSLYVDAGFNGGEYESGKTELIAAVNIVEDLSKIEKIGEDSVCINATDTFKVSAWFDDGSVSYYTGEYSPGRPYKLNVQVSPTEMTVTDCRGGYDPQTHMAKGGNTANVIMQEGLYNLMAREYWYNGASKISSPWGATINNSSAVVIHAIDAPLIYADGNSYDANGAPVPTQFIYKYKKLAQQK